MAPLTFGYMGAGLIYAGIVAAWAVVLVPRWLARHDERVPVIATVPPGDVDQAVRDRAVSTSRVLDRAARQRRLGSGKGSLEHRSAGARSAKPAAARRNRRSAGTAGARSRHARPSRAGTADHAPSRSPIRTSSAKPAPTAAARQRRRMLGTLLAVAALLGVGVSQSTVPILVALAGFVAPIGYLTQLRAQVRQARRRDGRRQILVRQAAARRTAVAAARRAGRVGSLRRRVGSPGRPVLVNPDGTWNPIPLPLPTYITAPVVDRPARIIDVSATGSWTSSRLGRGPLPVEMAVPDDVGLPEEYVDLPEEERKVVNG
ncbi:MAG: hypothetical protein L0Y54_04790 [Sporichthyaceae bacterium]|nr:hypothetical protein [Sporichthyaceae bacterium]